MWICAFCKVDIDVASWRFGAHHDVEVRLDYGNFCISWINDERIVGVWTPEDLEALRQELEEEWMAWTDDSMVI